MNDDADDLNDLKDLFDTELPKPDPARRADAIALAMKNFDRTQETADAARQTSESQPKGIFRGAIHMLFQMNTRAVLTATTALAAVALVAVIPVVTRMPDRLTGGGTAGRTEVAAPDPAPQPEVFSADDVQALAPGEADAGDLSIAAEEEMAEAPLPPVAVTEPIDTPSANNSTVLPSSAVPVNVGVVSLVRLSSSAAPASLAAARSGVLGAAGAVVSSSKLAVAWVAALPAASETSAVTEMVPSAGTSFAGTVNVQFPLASTCAA